MENGMILCNEMGNRKYVSLELDEDLDENILIDVDDVKYAWKSLDKEEKKKYKNYDEFFELNKYDYEKDIYQYYIISESDAIKLMKLNKNQIVFYDMELDLYVWGITSFGIRWEGVEVA